MICLCLCGTRAIDWRPHAAQMSFSESVFYYWSDKEWDSCDKFREAATKILNPKGIPNMLEWSASDTQVLQLSFKSSLHRAKKRA